MLVNIHTIAVESNENNPMINFVEIAKNGENRTIAKEFFPSRTNNPPMFLGTNLYIAVRKDSEAKVNAKPVSVPLPKELDARIININANPAYKDDVDFKKSFRRDRQPIPIKKYMIFSHFSPSTNMEIPNNNIPDNRIEDIGFKFLILKTVKQTNMHMIRVCRYQYVPIGLIKTLCKISKKLPLKSLLAPNILPRMESPYK